MVEGPVVVGGIVRTVDDVVVGAGSVVVVVGGGSVVGGVVVVCAGGDVVAGGFVTTGRGAVVAGAGCVVAMPPAATVVVVDSAGADVEVDGALDVVVAPAVVEVGREVVVMGDWVATCSLGDVSSPVATSKSMAARAREART